MTRRTVLSSIACYLGLVLLVAGFAVLRVRTQNRFAAQTAPDSLPMYGREINVPDPHAKPFFSIQTSRTYSTSDRARVSVNYRGVQSLDFRVYKVKDPVKFFRELEDPHRVGEDEEGKVGELTKRKPTFLENLRQFKSYVYGTIKRYVRSQLQNQSRKGFNQRFRVAAEEEEAPSVRTPLNVGELARVPLLNPDQMIDSWREELPPLEDAYDRRTISLGRREPGVYLVEAVNGDLRAFGLAIVTDIAMVEKASNDGQMLFYVVERKSGAPRAGVNVQIIRGRDDVTKGTTDQQGILRTQLVKKQPPTEEGGGRRGRGRRRGGAGGGRDGRCPLPRHGERRRRLRRLRPQLLLLRGRRGRRRRRRDDELPLHRPARLPARAEGLLQRHPPPVDRPGLSAAARLDRQRLGRRPERRSHLRAGAEALDARHLQRRTRSAGRVAARLLHHQRAGGRRRRPPAASRCRSTRSPSSR